MPRPKSSEASFEIDERVCPLEAVQSAAYTFTDRAYVRVEPSASGKLKVVMTFKAVTTPEVQGALKGEFDNELLHQALRLRVSDANRKIREFIVTKALVSAQPAALGADAASAATAEACPDCAASGQASGGAPAAAPIDEALEKEIDRLLVEIEKGGGDADPLGVNVPWEEKFSSQEKGRSKEKNKPTKPAADAAPVTIPAPKEDILDKEIDRLLVEIEKGGDGADVLGGKGSRKKKPVSQGKNKPKGKSS